MVDETIEIESTGETVSPADVDVKLWRAGGIGDNIVPILRVDVEEEVPDGISLNEVRELYAQQARELSNALFTSLPGGTLDALLVEMMSRKASLFRVPFVTKENG